MLGSDIAVGYSALPQRGVVKKGLEDWVMVIGGDFEQFRGFFVCCFADFPDLEVTTVGLASGQNAPASGPSKATSRPPWTTHLVYPAICKREGAEILFSVSHDGQSERVPGSGVE